MRGAVLFAVSCGCGVLSAWGIGGGTLLLLALTLFLGVDAPSARTVNLLFFLPAGVGALWFHIRGRLLERRVLIFAVPAACAAALLGALLAHILNPALIRRPFGLLLLLSGIGMLRKGSRRGTEHPERPGCGAQRQDTPLKRC